MNARTTLGACLVLAAILAGATFLDRAQRLVPSTPPHATCPPERPWTAATSWSYGPACPPPPCATTSGPPQGRRSPAGSSPHPLRRETLVPAELLLTSSQHAGLVELPVRADPGGLPEGLRPGDQVQVLAAWTEGARRGRAEVLLQGLIRPHRRWHTVTAPGTGPAIGDRRWPATGR
jgi:hypothetical protein